jgi:acylphosphatase
MSGAAPSAGARRFLVRGRVQGVGFRYFVVERARDLGLIGFTRNLPDGSVEVQAAGSADVLDELARALEEGPALSRVEGVRGEETPVDPAWTEFRISF